MTKARNFFRAFYLCRYYDRLGRSKVGTNHDKTVLAINTDLGRSYPQGRAVERPTPAIRAYRPGASVRILPGGVAMHLTRRDAHLQIVWPRVNLVFSRSRGRLQPPQICAAQPSRPSFVVSLRF